MDAQCEKMIEVYSEWLNQHHAANGESFRVSRSNYDEYNDPPQLLLDSDKILSGSIYERRIITLICSPYHDEGGPAILTAFFDGNHLHTMLQHFDTDDSIIFLNGRYDG